MKDTTTFVPEIIEHINPVTEQFGPLSHNSNQMQIPATVKEVPGFLRHLLTPGDQDQDIVDKATD